MEHQTSLSSPELCVLANQPAYCHTTTSLTGSRSQIRRDQSHNNKRYIAGLFQFVTASELAARARDLPLSKTHLPNASRSDGGITVTRPSSQTP